MNRWFVSVPHQFDSAHIFPLSTLHTEYSKVDGISVSMFFFLLPTIHAKLHTFGQLQWFTAAEVAAVSAVKDVDVAAVAVAAKKWLHHFHNSIGLCSVHTLQWLQQLQQWELDKKTQEKTWITMITHIRSIYFSFLETLFTLPNSRCILKDIPQK